MGSTGVTTHLSHIFTKLGITNRSKLAVGVGARDSERMGRSTASAAT
jgi:DNA-binding NarL/FixJ family response regulator